MRRSRSLRFSRAASDAVGGAVQDYRLGFRTLTQRYPTFAILGSAILALTVGANSAVFRLIDALWLRPPLVAAPECLAVVLHHSAATVDGDTDVFSAGVARRALTAVGGVSQAAWEVVPGDVSGDFRPRVNLDNGLPLNAVAVSDQYFSVLGVVVRGRGFLRTDDVFGTAPAVVISDDLWRTRLGSDPRIIGSTIQLTKPATVVGIAPRGFRGPFRGDRVDLWLPIGALEHFAPGTGLLLDLAPVRTFVRLNSVGLRDVAQAGLSITFGSAIRLRTLRESAYPPSLQSGAARDAQLLALAWALSLVVFAVGCLSFAGLVTTRVEERQHELRVRWALGISRLRLVHFLMAEPVEMAVVGALGSLVVSRTVLALVADFPLASRIPIGALNVGIDWRLGASISLAILVALVAAGFGSFWAVSLREPILGLARPKQSSSGAFRKRQALLVLHVSVSMVLLVLAALLVRSVQRALSADLGYATEHLIAVLVQPRLAQYAGGRGDLNLVRRRQDYLELIEQVRRLPGVAAATTGAPPLTEWGGPTSSIRLQVGANSVEARAQYRHVGLAYLTVVGIPVLAGRDFGDTDFLPGAVPVVILSDRLVPHLGAANVIGRWVTFSDGREAQVVGIAREATRTQMRGEGVSTVYLPSSGVDQGMLAIVVRTTPPPDGVKPHLLVAVQRLFPGAVQAVVRTHDDDVRREMASERLGAIAFSWFGGISAVLSLSSVYAAVAYRTRARRREWGIRIALGAIPADVLRRILLVHGLAPVVLGVCAGVVTCMMATGLVRAYLFGVSPADLVSLGMPALWLIGGGIVAAYVASRPLLRVNPAQLFRNE